MVVMVVVIALMPVTVAGRLVVVMAGHGRMVVANRCWWWLWLVTVLQRTQILRCGATGTDHGDVPLIPLRRSTATLVVVGTVITVTCHLS